MIRLLIPVLFALAILYLFFRKRAGRSGPEDMPQERDSGLDVLSIGDELLVEDFARLGEYKRKSSFDIREEKPLFDDDYTEQNGRADGVSRALEEYLRQHLPFPFKALAGDGRADVVRLSDSGKKAYVFIVAKHSDGLAIRLGGQRRFYYDLPRILDVLACFVGERPYMDRVIWMERGSGFFMFVVQRD